MAVQAETETVYFGTYTAPGKSAGIYRSELNLASGKLSDPVLAVRTGNPSFLAIAPGEKVLYAVGEAQEGGVHAFAINPKDGQLTLLNSRSAGGSTPCHVSLDASGRTLLISNYMDGTVASLPLATDGRLGPVASLMKHTGSGPNKGRQEAPHAHSANVSLDNKYVYVADLGIDKLMTYTLNPASGALQPASPPFSPADPGAGPRHLAFHPNGRFAYVINELNNTLAVYAYAPENGALQEIQVFPTLPADFTAYNTTAEVRVHPTGKFVYGSNRGHDSIVIYACNPDTGRLTWVGHEPSGGRTPRNFNIDPTGKFLLAANQDGGNVVVFRIDPVTGKLERTGGAATLSQPVCVRFLAPK